MLNQTARLRAHILTVTGIKGGVGKTTLAVNLAVGIRQQHPKARVILVDSDLYAGDVAIATNMRSNLGLIDLASLLIDQETVDDDTLKNLVVNHSSGIDLLLSPQYPRYPVETGEMSGELFHKLLTVLRAAYHYVIIDTAPQLSPTLSAAMEMTDRAIVVTTPSLYALKDSKILIGELTNLGFESSSIFLLLNQYSDHAAVEVKHIRNFLNQKVGAIIPYEPDCDSLVQSSKVLISEPDKRVSVQALKKAVKEILELHPMEMAEVGSTTGLTHKLLSHAESYAHPRREHVSILLVDDDENIVNVVKLVLHTRSMLQLAAENLRIEGHVPSADKVFDLMEKNVPDIVVMDINMPGMSPFDATRLLKSRYPSVGVIILSGEQDIANYRLALKSGADDFISKDQMTKLRQAITDTYKELKPVREAFFPEE